MAPTVAGTSTSVAWRACRVCGKGFDPRGTRRVYCESKRCKAIGRRTAEKARNNTATT
jgi:hypothetical protein